MTDEAWGLVWKFLLYFLFGAVIMLIVISFISWVIPANEEAETRSDEELTESETPSAKTHSL